MKHEHGQKTAPCGVCTAIVCEDCIDRHMTGKHSLFRSGFPHPKAQETADRIGAKMEGKTDSWKAEFYCENQACDVREVTIRVKEFHYDPPHVRGPFRCPNCADGLKFHWVRNSVEWSAEEDRKARFLVNLQRARRDAVNAARDAGEEHPNAIEVQSPTRLVNLEKLRTMSAPYASWNEPILSSVIGWAPEMHTTELPVTPATHKPVTALVRPHPAVTMHTPGSPEVRA